MNYSVIEKQLETLRKARRTIMLLLVILGMIEVLATLLLDYYG